MRRGRVGDMEIAGVPVPIPKGDGCIGCPFHRLSRYFTPDVVVPGSKVFFLEQAPGEDEEIGHHLINRAWQYDQRSGRSKAVDEYDQVSPQPLIGATGRQFDTKFLPRTGLKREEVSIGNAIRCRPGRGLGLKNANDLPPITSTMRLESSKAEVVQALRHCRDTYLHIPDTVELVVTGGRYAMFSLTGIQAEENEYGRRAGVMESWRGYGVDHPEPWEDWYTVDTTRYHPFQSGRRIFFTMHISALFRGSDDTFKAGQASMKRFMHATLLDYTKIKHILAGTWPHFIPTTWSVQAPATWPSYSCFDTEYNPEKQYDSLIRWSLCDDSNNLYCVEGIDTPDIITIAPGSTVLMQNAKADLPYLTQMVDFNQVRVEDLLMADTILYTGEPHNLNFIASKHGRFNKYKHLGFGGVGKEYTEVMGGDGEMVRVRNDQLYSVLDVVEPMHIWKTHHTVQFRHDAESWRLYRQVTMPLVAQIMKAEKIGVKVNTERLIEVQMTLNHRIQQYRERAMELTGNAKFNLGGYKQVYNSLYEEG
jgi:uracil-DNA glycosylase